ncbi:enolase C-terminal domain-like protein [Streptomyces sp. S465]|uniref:enolase C-terminal domain-like protein n=1 Tax=Streptomyces sp. S465 TaxID=2979468 RepID=UPI0022A854BB|nr:enolase C-terminal domain-like protein [Streptomyces sp. S465]WAP53943.1 hypothetical protein N6H00_02650 [Streptomyces sp. S465]
MATGAIATLVKATTFDGAVGWGESFGPPRLIAPFLAEQAEALLGQPADIREDRILDRLSPGYHLTSGGPHTATASGIDIALWDAQARAFGVPVAHLLGSRLHDRVDAHASSGYVTATRDPGPFRDTMAAHAAEGFTAVKSKIGRQLAAALNPRLSPRCWGTGVVQAATLQPVSAVPRAPFGMAGGEPLIFEFDRGENPLRDGVLATPLTPEDGTVAIPDGPGLGVTILLAAVAALRCRPATARPAALRVGASGTRARGGPARRRTRRTTTGPRRGRAARGFPPTPARWRPRAPGSTTVRWPVPGGP